MIAYDITQDGEPFLGAVDKLGTAYEDSTIATGLGAYMATPLLRDALDKGPLDEESAKYELLYFYVLKIVFFF